MTAWWEKPYPGGPMVAVKGFPRPLYPPDAAPGYQPSCDGPDVEAYKRTVSRAGRWEWTKFDQAFSNAFSHGKTGGNVAESGLAGVQRQASGTVSPATGFLGKETFELLRSIRIPDGLPNAGQAAMDAAAVELVNDAYDRFKGKPQPEPSGGNSAKARLARAQSQIGKKESPANSNRTPYGAWYGQDGQPWCAQFVTWCDLTGDEPSPNSFAKGSRWAYVPYVVEDARHGRHGLSITSAPKPGDLVCFDWDGGEFDHIGIFESGSPLGFRSVEGNTSTSDNSNGGQVMRRDRAVTQAHSVVFVRVKE